jgi:ferrous iron transport protein A
MDALVQDWMLSKAALSGVATLDMLGAGEQGRIRSVEGELAVRRRLLEMGLCRGTPVRVVRRAPLGDPIELHVRGYLLSLRADQARLITLDMQDERS